MSRCNKLGPIPSTPGPGVHIDHNTGAARCYTPKNRYLSIDPTVNSQPVAYHVTLTQLDDQYDDSCLPLTGWLSVPWSVPFGSVSYVIDVPPLPFGAPNPNGLPQVRYWTGGPSYLHVTGCEVVPAATYEIRASTDGITPLEPPLTIMTSHNPLGPAQHWGDVTSEPGATIPWRPPEYATSFTDISAVIKTFENTGGPAGSWSDIEIDHAVSFGDVNFVIKAFEGARYPEIANLGGVSVWPNYRPFIGHEPLECLQNYPTDP